MSWNINGTGPVAVVREQVAAETCYEQRNGIPGTANEAQFERAKALVLADLDQAPPDWHAQVQANGHAYEGASTQQVFVTLQPAPAPVLPGP